MASGNTKRLSLGSLLQRDFDEARAEARLFTLYAWFVIYLLYAVPTLALARGLEQQESLSLGLLALGINFALLIKFKRSQFISNAALIVSFILLSLIPLFNGELISPKYQVIRDLYFLLILSVPAFFRAWSWRLNVGAAVIALGSLIPRLLAGHYSSVVQSGLLICLAAVLSSLVLWFKSHRVGKVSDRLRSKSLQLLNESDKRAIASRLWTCTVLATLLIVVLLVLEFGFFAQDSADAVVPKLYGLIVLILFSTFALLTGTKRLGLLAFFGAAALNLSLAVADAKFSAAHPLTTWPIILNLFICCFIFWEPSYQIVLVCLSILSKLFVSAIFSGAQQGLPASLLNSLRVEPLEVVLLVLGGTLSVLTLWSIRNKRAASLLPIIDLADLELEGGLRASSREHLRTLNISKPAKQQFSRALHERMTLGLFCLGLFSGSWSTQMLLGSKTEEQGVSLSIWLVFLSLWGLLALYRERASNLNLFWRLGLCLAFFFEAVPAAIFLHQETNTGSWWLWPLIILLSLGSVPWRGVDLFFLFMVNLCLSLLLLQKQEFAALPVGLTFIAFIIGIYLSLAVARGIRDRLIFPMFYNALAKAADREQVLRTFADFSLLLFGGNSALLSSHPEHLELLKSSRSYELKSSDCPLSDFCSSLHSEQEEGQEESGVCLKVLNWLPAKLSILDSRFGLLHPNFGVLIELLFEDGELGKDTLSGPVMCLILTPVPSIRGLLRDEISRAEVLATLARDRFLVFAQAEAEQSLNRAQEQQQQQREYELSSLVHDINNTVQDLTLLCETIVEDNPEPEPGETSEGTFERVRRIAAIARSMATVVSDAKHRRELEKTEDLSPREVVDICEVLRELSTFAKIRAERKRISVNPPQLPLQAIYVRISAREHLETILRNILNNAILYSPPGSAIFVSLELAEQTVSIKVRDTGVGLSVEDCEKIFTAGYRGQAASSLNSGLGLGLAESRRVAKAAGGDIQAASGGLGQGAVFSLHLPRHFPQAELKSGSSWALLVDDQPTLTEMYSRIIRALQLEPEIASSVEEAWQRIKDKGRPALVLTDVHLGASNGLDLVRRLRSEFGTQLPILVISGLNSEAVLREAREVGATDFVSKPVGRRALFARIQSLTLGNA